MQQQEFESLCEGQEEGVEKARSLRSSASLRAAPKLLIGAVCLTLLVACATLTTGGRGLSSRLLSSPQRLLGLQGYDQSRALPGYGQSRALPGVNSIRIFQWNPHYTCTQHRTCEQATEESLDDVLVRGRVDFANVIYMRDLQYQTPGMHKSLVKSCNQDSVWLTYNSLLWTPEGTGQSGCLAREDRAYVVQTFTHVYHSVSLVVVAVHYSRSSVSVDNLRRAIELERRVRNVREVLVMADLNRQEHRGQAVLQELGVPHPTAIQMTENVKSCCQDDGFQQSFDHILANFGRFMETQLVHDPAPSWARGRFHKGVLAQLTFDSGMPTSGRLDMAPQGRPLGVPETSSHYYPGSHSHVHQTRDWQNHQQDQFRDHQMRDWQNHRRDPFEGHQTRDWQNHRQDPYDEHQMRDGQNQVGERDWKLHQGKHCYSGFGADSLPMETTTSLSECQSRCVSKGYSCEGIVMTAAQQGSCWPVRSVRLAQCKTDATFILWLKP